MAAIGGDELEERIGDRARAAWTAEIDTVLEEMAPLPGARELLVAVRERGHRLVLASSGSADQVDHHLDLLDARDVAEAWTTSADVQASKPAPDLLQVALQKLGEPLDAPAVMVGDSVFDVQAATRAGMPAIAVRSGGFGDDELRDAGAVDLFDTPGDLRAALDRTALS